MSKTTRDEARKRNELHALPGDLAWRIRVALIEAISEHPKTCAQPETFYPHPYSLIESRIDARTPRDPDDSTRYYDLALSYPEMGTSGYCVAAVDLDGDDTLVRLSAFRWCY